MEPKNIRCPSCGAEKIITNPGIVTVVCEYCGTAIYWDRDKVMSAGRQSLLPEGFTRLYRGATGRLKGHSFTVTGRVRYSFGKGFWDEWFLEFQNGSLGWLTEDNHELALQTKKELENCPPPDSLSPGAIFRAFNREFVVQEVGQAECLGMEGDLPIRVETGEKYLFADASSPDGKYTLGIEYDQEPPSVFLGKWLDYTDLRLDDEGLDW